MKYKEVQLLSFQECSDKLKEEVDYLVKLRFAHAVSPIENPMKIRQTRRVIARLRTAQHSYHLDNHQKCNHNAQK